MRVLDGLFAFFFCSGSVWRGCYQGADVAIKKSLAAGFKAQMDQMDEIKLVAALPLHPNVLHLMGAYLEENAVCSVSPLMLGGSLDRRMAGPDSAWLDDPVHVIAVVCGLFDGLAHLHRHGVLHRDLAPRNILFDPQGRPVLCDFGLSRLTQDRGKVLVGELYLIRHFAFCVTGLDASCFFGLVCLSLCFFGQGLHHMTVGLQIPIRWMAPEVLSGQPQYFYASDVWSMGVVVWQLLTRHAEPYPEVPDMMGVVHGYVCVGISERNLRVDCLARHHRFAWLVDIMCVMPLYFSFQIE
jgi:serine/threonine protein kinase